MSAIKIDRHPLLGWVTAFAAAQWVGYGVMFLSTMFVARRLGTHTFGVLAFAQVLIQHAVLLIEFGYPFSATRRIALARDDPQALSLTFSRILACQLLLLATVGGVVAGAWFLLQSWRAPLALVMVGGTALVGSALQPTWLLLGLERLQALAVIQLAGRLCMLALVLALVRGPDDVHTAIFILGLPPLISGCAILLWSVRCGWVRWLPPAPWEIRAELREAFGMFAPGVVSTVYTGLPSVVLGIVAPPTAMAYFSLADRLKSAAIVAVQPFLSALIARMSALFEDDSATARRMAMRSLGLHAGIGLMVGLALFVGADLIILVAGGEPYLPASRVLRWMAFVPLLVCVSAVASLHVLLPNGKVAVINRIVLGVSAVGLVWLWPYVSQGGDVAAAQFLLVSECLTCAAMWWFAWRLMRSQ